MTFKIKIIKITNIYKIKLIKCQTSKLLDHLFYNKSILKEPKDDLVYLVNQFLTPLVMMVNTKLKYVNFPINLNYRPKRLNWKTSYPSQKLLY
jgi:hypothetical protein